LRLRHLFGRLHQVLEARRLTLRFTLLGVDHTGHLLPDVVPSLAEADLVTLELPTTPVKAYLETGRREEMHVRNIFWQDLLEYFAAHPAPGGVYGVNVNPHVRYLRGRFYYRGGFLVNDFEAPVTVVEPGAPGDYSLEEVGGAGDARISADAVLQAMPAEARDLLARNGMAHVGPRQNPYGPGRHLVLLAAPPAELVDFQETLTDHLLTLAGQHGMERSALLRLVFSQLLEGLLLPINDFYLLEQLFRHVIHAATAAAEGSHLRMTHVAGYAHLQILARYLEPARSPRFVLEAVTDPRLPLHPAYMVPGYLTQHLEEGLSALSLRGDQFNLDRPAAERLLERYLTEAPEDVERRVLLRALWTRDLPPPTEFHTLADEVPLQPSAAYLDTYATRLDRLILEHVLGDQPLIVLREMNERLGATRRRGLVSALAQELQDLGWGYQALRKHPVVGPHARRVDRVREGLLEGREPVRLFREALSPGAGA
jgi:hypothetical protein